MLQSRRGIPVSIGQEVAVTRPGSPTAVLISPNFGGEILDKKEEDWEVTHMKSDLTWLTIDLVHD